MRRQPFWANPGFGDSRHAQGFERIFFATTRHRPPRHLRPARPDLGPALGSVAGCGERASRLPLQIIADCARRRVLTAALHVRQFTLSLSLPNVLIDALSSVRKTLPRRTSTVAIVVVAYLFFTATQRCEKKLAGLERAQSRHRTFLKCSEFDRHSLQERKKPAAASELRLVSAASVRVRFPKSRCQHALRMLWVALAKQAVRF